MESKKSGTTRKYLKELDVALGAVREAAVLCQSVQAGISPETLEKKDRSPVTVADFGSQALVCRALSRSFPSDPVIAEESAEALRTDDNAPVLGRLMTHVRRIRPAAQTEAVLSWIDHGGASEYSPRFWTLDPIDGTKGFLRGDQYAVSLALVVEGELTVAVLGCPNLPWSKDSTGGTIFTAVKGLGAFEFPLDGEGEPKRINVSHQNDPSRLRFCESVEAAHSAHDDHAAIARKIGIEADPVRIDSQAKYAVVARGQAEAYLRLPKDDLYREKIWDHAGGALVVCEAGGKVTDILGRPLEFNHGRTLEQNRGVIVSNGSLHDAILDAVRDLKIAEKKGIVL